MNIFLTDAGNLTMEISESDIAFWNEHMKSMRGYIPLLYNKPLTHEWFMIVSDNKTKFEGLRWMNVVEVKPPHNNQFRRHDKKEIL